MRICLEVEIRRVHCRRCNKVKQEKLPWLAANPLYTQRFARHVGRRCRDSTIQDVAKELKLDWKIAALSATLSDCRRQRIAF